MELNFGTLNLKSTQQAMKMKILKKNQKRQRKKPKAKNNRRGGIMSQVAETETTQKQSTHIEGKIGEIDLLKSKPSNLERGQQFHGQRGHYKPHNQNQSNRAEKNDKFDSELHVSRRAIRKPKTDSAGLTTGANPSSQASDKKKDLNAKIRQRKRERADEINDTFLSKFLNTKIISTDDQNMKNEQKTQEKEKEKNFNSPLSDTQFDDPEIGLNPIIVSSLQTKFKNHKFFSKIQLEIFQKIIDKKNCLIRSETGSGKTLAYLLPIYHQLLAQVPKISRKSGIQCLIMCPTRELCLQIYQQCKLLSFKCVYIVSGMFVGGESIQKEKERLRKGLNIVIGTPSKLAYHLKNTKNFDMSLLKWLVIEECDLGFGMGQGRFIKEVMDIVTDYEVNDYSRTEKVVKILTTASFSQKVEEVMSQMVTNNEYDLVGEIQLEKLQRTEKTLDILIPANLRQNFTFVREEQKNAFLLCLVHHLQIHKLIVFVATADQANYTASLLSDTCHLLPRTRDTFVQKEFSKDDMEETKLLETNVFVLHGHIDHAMRKDTYNSFKACERGVLISTGVGARGLDFPGVKLIVVFDPPESLSHYTNKIGRTARMTASGASLIVLHQAENRILGSLKERFQMNYVNPDSFWFGYEKSIPKYYPLEDATVYLSHCIKKVSFLLGVKFL